jgi:putative sugar O-methyltransferase
MNFLKKKKIFIGSKKIRSNSDNGTYISSVLEATENYDAFTQFKKDPRYQAILEHTTFEQGLAYLEIVKLENPQLLDSIDLFKENDLIGGASTYDYKDIGSISPSTLRYLKVTSDLIKYFGDMESYRIAEIGVGYGGQLLTADKVLKFKQYDLFDLPPVLTLASMYIESFNLRSAYKTTTLNQHCGSIEYDLVLSNYSFSELPAELQLSYIRKVLSKAKRGYLTMNTGKTVASQDNNKLTLDDLLQKLPGLQVLEESPLTNPNNYVLVWGN